MQKPEIPASFELARTFFEICKAADELQLSKSFLGAYFLMAIYKVQNMTLVAQLSNGVCWWASSQMCYLWSQATGKGSMVEPDSDEGFKARHQSNGDWFCGKNGFMADAFKMKKFTSLTMDYDSLKDFMIAHGPVFTSVEKNWDGHTGYGHAIVMCGVADTGVWIYDPEPVNVGGSKWMTWDQINKATGAVADTADYGFLTAA